MGNSASKKARLEQLEKDYAQTSSNLATRDQELARAQQGLETSKQHEDRLSDEAEALRKKCTELDTLSKALEREQEKHIAKLQADLKLKGDEVIAQRRVVESRTFERDDARRLLSQMKEKLGVVEQTSQTSSEDFERRRKELEASAEIREQELVGAKTDSNSLAEKIKLLEEKHEQLSAEFENAKSTAEEKLAASRVAAEQELSSARANAADELADARASMGESARNLSSVSSELANTKASLSATMSKLDTLTRTHNESVSRRAASHEAFTATKQELADAQKKYLTLYESHDKLIAENESATRALATERESKDALKAELAALRKKLGETETRKTVPDISIQEVRPSTDVTAAA